MYCLPFQAKRNAFLFSLVLCINSHGIPWVLITDPTSRVEEPVSCSVTDTRTVDVGLPSMGTLWADRPFVVSFGCGGENASPPRQGHYWACQIGLSVL